MTHADPINIELSKGQIKFHIGYEMGKDGPENYLSTVCSLKGLSPRPCDASKSILNGATAHRGCQSRGRIVKVTEYFKNLKKHN
jgi:hypothetical protein